MRVPRAHSTRSAVAPGALEIGHGPLPQLSGTTLQLQPLRQECLLPLDGRRGRSQPALPKEGGEQTRWVGRRTARTQGLGRAVIRAGSAAAFSQDTTLPCGRAAGSPAGGPSRLRLGFHPGRRLPGSVRTSSHRVAELRGSGQSQVSLSPQKANHHPCLRHGNSLPGTNGSAVSRAGGPGRRGGGAGQTGPVTPL